MLRLSSYVLGEWHPGGPPHALLFDPTTEEPVAECPTLAVDFGAVTAFARERGGPALRELGFAGRGALLKGLSGALHEQREELIEIAVKNGGNTRGDAKFDIDGAIGTLAAYAGLAKSLPDRPFLVDGEGVQLGRTARFFGQHVLVPRRGVAVHVNAFNFPSWGMMEKLACSILAGVPVIEKPGTPTAWLAWRAAQIAVETGLLPPGAFQFVAGSAGDLLDHLGPQDCLAFTGSSITAAKLRANPNLIRHSVRINVEADSLNAAVLAPDVDPGSETYGLFLANVVLDMTQKAGQKCTAVRRVLVPEGRLGAVRDDLVAELARIQMGDPAERATRLGPVASAAQFEEVRAGIERLAAHGELATGGLERPTERGWFVQPTLCVARDPGAEAFHDREVFGPAASLLSFDGDAGRAAALVARGAGGLVCSAYSNDAAWTESFVLEAAPWHGRIWLGSDRVAEQALAPGMVLPQTIHGGPGRAGGGEELGGARGLALYLQRVALQGFKGSLEALTRDAGPA